MVRVYSHRGAEPRGRLVRVLQMKKIKGALFLLMIAPCPLLWAQSYTIDPASSEAKILVFKKGTFSALAHNHVIFVPGIEGSGILYKAAPEKSTFDISISVSKMQVDLPEMLAEEGEAFEAEFSAGDIEDIQATMLAEEMLDVNNHPTIRIQSDRITGDWENLQVKAMVTIRGSTRTLEILPEVTLEAKGFQSRGQFSVKQTLFDIEPVSLFLGTVQVKDEIVIKFNITGIFDDP